MTSRARLTLAIAAFLATAAANARAAILYRYFYEAAQPTYTSVPAGSALVVPVYLVEVNQQGTGTSLLASEHGLAAAAFSVSAAAVANPTTITAISGNKGSTPTGFDEPPVPTLTASAASVLESVNINDAVGVEPTPLGNGSVEVLLGTITLHASPAGNQTTTFTLAPYARSSGNTYTNDNLYDLDNNADPANPPGSSSLYLSAASTTFTLTTAPVIPDPTPTPLTLLPLTALATRRPRRP
jgi:hypothetical protein